MTHANKIILRIVVTVLILAVCGAAVWLLFFLPSDAQGVFNSLTSLETGTKKDFSNKINGYVDDKDVKHKGIEVSNALYPAGGAAVVYDITSGNEKLAKVAKYRAFMFDNNSAITLSNPEAFKDGVYTPYIDVLDMDGGYSIANADGSTLNSVDIDKYANFESIYEAIDDAYTYYYSYSQLATGVDNGTINTLNGYIKDFKNAINGFNKKADEILNLQVQIPSANDATVINEIYLAYKALYNKFFDVLKTYNDLTINLKDYVNKFVFDSNPVFDESTVLYEITTKTISQFTNNGVFDVVEGLTFKDDTTDAAKAEAKTKYAKFLSYSFDAMKMSSLAKNEIDLTIIQNYIDATNYKGENASTANAIWGENNIFTLTRDVKAGIKNGTVAVSDYYNTEGGLGDAIINLVRLYF